MKRQRRHFGFSLTETLLAVGTLAVGLLFVAGTFLAGIHFSTISTERTIGAVAAGEAFAKIRYCGLDPNDSTLQPDQHVPVDALSTIDVWEFAYPSTPGASLGKQYFWTAVCRRVSQDSRLVQVTVFVARRTVSGANYWMRDRGAQLTKVDYPRALAVEVKPGTAADQLLVEGAVEEGLIGGGYRIVDDQTGRLFRVIERIANGAGPDTIVLDRPWDGGSLPGWIWVVAAPSIGGRNPLVGVYQKVIRL